MNQERQQQMNTKFYLFLPVILIIVTITFFFSGENEDKAKKKKRRYKSLNYESVFKSDDFLKGFMDLGLIDDELFSLDEIQNFIQLLQREESATINTHSGIHSVSSRIENFCRQMVNNKDKESFQENLFQSCFEELAKAAFPSKFYEITNYYKNLVRYRNWLESQKNSNIPTGSMEWDVLVWQKRYEIFGMEASEELYASERYLKNIKLQMDANAASNKSLENKIDMLKDNIANVIALQENPKDKIGEEFIEYGEMFLSAPKVQENLWSLSPDRRNELLRKIRISVGVPESRLDELEAWDVSRINEWEKGQLYLKELKRLKTKHESNDDQFKQDSERLRLLLFGNEQSEEIYAEEQKGMNRFLQKPTFLLQ